MSITLSSKRNTKYKVKIVLGGHRGDHQGGGIFNIDIIDVASQVEPKIVETGTRRSLGAAFKCANEWLDGRRFKL